MKRVLHVVERMDQAGAQTVIMRYYRALDRSKVQFDFLYFTDDECFFDDEIHALGGRIHRVRLRGRSSIPQMLRSVYRTVKANPEIHVVHSHMQLAGAWHMAAARLAGVPVRIAHSHSTGSGRPPSLVNRIYEGSAKALIMAHATHRFACGEDAGRYLFPFSREFVIVPNAIDVQGVMAEAASGGEAIPEYREDRLRILQVGRLSPPKNPHFSVRLARALLDEGVDFTLLFAGIGPLEEDLRQEVLANDLMDHVVFLGPRSDVPKLMSECHVLVMPSNVEGLPVTLVEAQAVGIPSLVSSSVTREVDCSLGLVTVIDSTSPSVWAKEVIRAARKEPVPDLDRARALEKKGFEVSRSVHHLEHYYLV